MVFICPSGTPVHPRTFSTQQEAIDGLSMCVLKCTQTRQSVLSPLAGVTLRISLCKSKTTTVPVKLCTEKRYIFRFCLHLKIEAKKLTVFVPAVSYWEALSIMAHGHNSLNVAAEPEVTPTWV